MIRVCLCIHDVYSENKTEILEKIKAEENETREDLFNKLSITLNDEGKAEVGKNIILTEDEYFSCFKVVRLVEVLSINPEDYGYEKTKTKPKPVYREMNPK
jgi:hypothetical protein